MTQKITDVNGMLFVEPVESETPEWLTKFSAAVRLLKGGAGSGNFGHSGRPGVQGGSGGGGIVGGGAGGGMPEHYVFENDETGEHAIVYSDKGAPNIPGYSFRNKYPSYDDARNDYPSADADADLNIAGYSQGNESAVAEAKSTKFDTTKKTVNALSSVLGKKPTANYGQKGVYSANVSASKVKSVKAKLKEMDFEEYDDPLVQSGVSSWKNSAKVHVRIGEPFKSFGDNKPTINVSISQETGLAFIPQGQ